jgi:hypothetical protein
VLDGIASGRFTPDYVEAFLSARLDENGWPQTEDGKAWQVDHVYELWQGGEDNLSNYLPVDPRLHSIKSKILERFRLEVREGHLAEGEQVEVTEPL